MLGIGAAVVTVLVWTAFIVIARASAGRSLTPFDLACARICGASLVLVPWGAWLVMKGRRAARQGQAGAAVSSFFGLSPLSLRVTAAAGIFGGVAYAMAAYSGFFFAPAGHASVLMPGSLPLWTTLLAALVLRERITPMRALGLAMIVAGDLVVGGRSLLHAFEGGEVWKGDLLFMAAAFCWACYSVVARRHGLDAVRATIAITVFALMTYVPVYALLVAGGQVASHLGTAPWREVAFQMAFQGGGSVVISGITFTRMVQHFGPVRTTMITALVPGLSAFGAVIWLGEPLYWNLVAGLLLVTAGILFGVQKSAPARALPLVPLASSSAPVMGRPTNV
ncbi:EamA-like transporter family protein [Variovorax sp. OK605]|jgi:drug/metabolite transporter (DMT)-like permease|uniref:DMT family transporter n=1 Tax=unclassified Variovorax TaxID=663243 RepID=UPI0008C850CD|nr:MULTISPECIES: DMT family transporter [unclassified Variovorax]SEJ97996.1 EamA-like transporter family protein [Variovorax sp. OK202]SFD23487.1 EamA-like transporter family protein [Variovorax sp. OK212]SFP49343.1 EamA-like transporter family protein [Variovorax sp. OK605]